MLSRAIDKSNRLLWIACVVVLAIVVARGLTLGWEVSDRALRTMQHDTNVEAGVLAAQTSRYFQLVDAGLARIADAAREQPDAAMVAKHFDGAETHRMLANLMLYLPQANGIAIIGIDGGLINTSRSYPFEPIDGSDRDYYRIPAKDSSGEIFVSTPEMSRASKRPVIFLARRMVAADGRFAGVALAVLDVGALRDFYRSLDMGAGRGVTLARNDGTALVAFPDDVPLGGMPLLEKDEWARVLTDRGGSFSVPDGTGATRFVSVHPVRGVPLALGLSLHEADALGPWRGLNRIILFQTLIACVVVFGLFVFIHRLFASQNNQTKAMAGTAAALRESEQRLRTYAELASDWFWEQDTQFRFTWTSTTSPMTLAGNNSDGMTRWEIAGADVADPSWAAHIECLKAHKPFKDFQFERAGAAGDIRHVSVSGAPVFDENGVFTGYRGSGRDITQEVEAERTLRAALERAEAANRAKSEFLTNMSHELRTPLNAIIGFSELIVTEAVGPVPSQYTSFATDILASGRHLLDLINELLDMSKIEAGQYTLSEEPIDLAPFVRSCMGTVEPKAREGDVALTYQPGLENVVLQADRRALRQIMLNLLANAIKFTLPGGTVTVEVDRLPRDRLGIAVRDTGVGIPEEALQRIGQPFQQADSSISRRFGGTGLGLAITKQLLAMHGGTLEIDSTVGKGTTVTACFPAQRVEMARDKSLAGYTNPPKD